VQDSQNALDDLHGHLCDHLSDHHVLRVSGSLLLEFLSWALSQTQSWAEPGEE
jgi:hypothetical protein